MTRFFLLCSSTLLALSICLAANTVYAQDADYRRPDFSLPDLDGRERSIAEWDGKPLIINFWATWCIPCKREIPLFNELQADHAGKGLQLLGIAVDTPENVRKFLAETGMDYPTLVEERRSQQVAEAITGSFLVLPLTIFLDHAGRIFWMQVEEIHREEADAVLARVWQIQSGALGFEEAQERLVEDLEKILAARNAGN